MADMPTRDITGTCEGPCIDRVAEMERTQQETIDRLGMKHATAETPGVAHARRRDNAPGQWGGHV